MCYLDKKLFGKCQLKEKNIYSDNTINFSFGVAKPNVV